MWKGQGSLTLRICIGGLLIAAAITGALVHTLHLDDVRVERLMMRYLYFRTSPLAGRRLHSAGGTALLRVLCRLMQGWDRWGDAELWDVVGGDDVWTERNPFGFVNSFSKHDISKFKAELS